MREPADGRTEGPPGGFFLNVNFVFVTTVASYGLAFLYVVLASRALGSDGRGVTALYQSAVNLGFAFFNFGIGTAIVYFVGRREMTPRAAMEAALSLTLAALGLTAIAVGVLVPLAGSRLSGDGIPYWLALVAIPAVVQGRAIDGVLRAEGRFGAMNLLEVMHPIVLLAGIAVLYGAGELTVSRTITLWSLSFVVPVAFGYAVVGRDAWPRRIPGLSQLSKPVRFGMQGQLGNLIQLLNYRLDAYLILLFVDTAGVGLYATGVTLSEGLWFIANSVSIVLLTNLTRGTEQQAGEVTPVVCRNTLLATALAAFAAGAASFVVIPELFGSDFDGAIRPFLWLLPGTVALSGTKVLAAYVFSRGKPLVNAWIALATLIATVALDLALIPSLGVTGAAIGASVAYCLSLTLTSLAYRQLSGLSIADALLPRFSDAVLYVNAWRSLNTRLRGVDKAGEARGGA